MEGRQNHYKELERYLTFSLIIDAIIFVMYLIVAGLGIIWLKVITAFLALALSALIEYYLYVNNELMRQRSMCVIKTRLMTSQTSDLEKDIISL